MQETRLACLAALSHLQGFILAAGELPDIHRYHSCERSHETLLLFLESLRFLQQGRLHHQDPSCTFPAGTRSIGSGLDNHKPFDRALRPEFYLRTLIRMLVEARIANPQQMFVVYVSYNIVPRPTNRTIEKVPLPWYHKEYVSREDRE